MLSMTCLVVAVVAASQAHWLLMIMIIVVVFMINNSHNYLQLHISHSLLVYLAVNKIAQIAWDKFSHLFLKGHAFEQYN